ncbi:hypothetical protein MTO96_052293 [Rhipicephalus appendiculatus]
MEAFPKISAFRNLRGLKGHTGQRVNREDRRALDRTCLSKFQSRWTCPRSCSGVPSKVRGRGLVSGSCQGAVAEAGLVDEAYRVRSSWVVA